MKYMIIRIEDERSSDICKSIEEKAEREGGLTFPFSIGKYRYDNEVLEKGMMSTGDYYTNLFHENCRSHIVPVSEESNLMYPGKKLDDTDKAMLTDGALSESAGLKMAASEEVSQEGVLSFFRGKFKLKIKQAIRFFTRSAR